MEPYRCKPECDILARMRFEIGSAFVMGGLLPFLATCLEYCRQGFKLSFADVRGDLDDYVAGALLLIAGWLSVKVRSNATIFAVLAWAYFTSLIFASSWGQIDDTLRGQAEDYNSAIIVFKLAILVVGATSLVLAYRRASLHRI
jgi:hypothetical protein